MSITMSQQTAMDSAVRHLVAKYNPKGNRVGWLMMSSILVEAWDLYSIAFVLIFIRDQFHPDPLLLGLAAAGTQGGALVGALLGGWLADKIGRRVMFLSTMIMFIIFALAAGLRARASAGWSWCASSWASRSAATSPTATPTSWSRCPRASAR